MEAQNRAISVSLFELRAEVLASVESGKLDFNRTKAQFLFERSISDKIKEYDAAISEYRRYKGLKDEFVSLIQFQRADDTYEEATDFLRAIQDYDSRIQIVLIFSNCKRLFAEITIQGNG